MPPTAPGASASGRPAANARWVFVALALACTAPLIGAYLVHEFWPPERRMNTGELIEPLPLPETVLWRLDETPLPLSQLKGRWIMVQVDEARCASACQRKLYQMRQVRLAQGRDMHRIERLWLVADDAPVAPPLIEEFAGTHILRARDKRFLARFPAQRDAREHIYLIDPLGNLMLRYARDADPSGMKRDLTRLLKLSRLG